MLLMLAGIARAGESPSRDWSGVGRVANVGGRAEGFRLVSGEATASLQIVLRLASGYRPILGGAPLIGAHHVIADHRIAIDAGVHVLQVMIEPADHVLVQRKDRVVRIFQLSNS